MSKFWSSIVSDLDPYVPGEQPKIQDLIKLNTNENPYGPSPRALQAMQEQIGDSLRLYPDPNCDALKDSIATCYGLTRDMVFVGNGSDEILAHTFQALLIQDKPLLFPDITYSFYPVYSRLYRVHYETVPLQEDFTIDPDNYRRPNGGILIANPNAPTGCYLELEQIEKLTTINRDSVVVVDEAYIDFGGESAAKLVDRFDNLLVIQTLSKSRALAGLRIGFAVGHRDLITALERVKNSFNSYPIDRIALAGAAAAMEDTVYFEAMRKKIIASRDKLAAGLLGLDFVVLPSLANFVFARCRWLDGSLLSQELRRRNILVRHFAKPRIDQFLRITVGTEKQCAQLIDCLKQIRQEHCK